MLAALGGFANIATVIGLGWLLAHLGILGGSAQAFLNRMAFLVASPALLFMVVGRGSLEHLFSRTLVVSVIAITVTVGLYLVANRLRFRHSLGAVTIGWMASAYTNAGNLGLPIAKHILGDMRWMAPILLLQVGLLQPFALACLDAAAARTEGVRLRARQYATLPFRNPITVGILAGLLVNVTRVPLPGWLLDSTGMVGNMAVPMMLIAFGISLRLDPLPGTGPHAVEVWTIQVLKVLLMPAVALGVGVAVGLERHDLLAVGVLAALPCAQNVFVIASRYRESMPVARDCVFWSTIGTVGVIIAIATVLG